jgi:hypothetical protein
VAIVGWFIQSEADRVTDISIPMGRFIKPPDSVLIDGRYLRHIGDFDTASCPPVWIEGVGMVCNRGGGYLEMDSTPAKIPLRVSGWQ